MMKRLLARGASGFTLIEMIVVVFLLAIAMLGILAVFDASARINKSEQQVADAQGSVRYGTYEMTRIIRMAGSGGLHVRQAVLDKPAAGLVGINGTTTFDNVPDTTMVMDLNGVPHHVRPGTDMIEVRGVILSPLYGLLGASCTGPCDGVSEDLNVPAAALNAILGQHINNDVSRRPQFDATYTYTSGVSSENPMFVLVAANLDQSSDCPPPFPTPAPLSVVTRYPQPFYNVALLSKAPCPTPPCNENTLTFQSLNFTDPRAKSLNGPDPGGGVQDPSSIKEPSRGGVLDDILFFIDNGTGDPPSNLSHPALARAIRRGDNFDVTAIADDVEDMQIAYGVDANDNGVDTAVSPAPGGDEWWPNVQTESAIPSFVQTGLTCPTLHGVMISLLAKSRDPDPTFKGSTASGFLMMNVPLDSNQIPITMATPGNYRRRVQTLRIAMRNYAYEEP